MLQGAGQIPLLWLCSLFLNPPARRPTGVQFAVLTIVCAIGGTLAGAAYYASDAWRARGGWRKLSASVGIFLVYVGTAAALLLLYAFFAADFVQRGT
jgi:hypothetical protein